MNKTIATRYINKFLNSTVKASKANNLTYTQDSFRVSSLPSCPIMEALGKPLGKSAEFDYKFDFYTSVGTAVHKVLQSNAVLGEHRADILGCWKCDCGVDERLQKYPGKCRRCGQNPVYEEITYRYPKKGAYYLSGHSDLILQAMVPNEKNRLEQLDLLVDFKTTDGMSIINPRYENRKYHIQCRAYVLLLWLLHEIKIDYYVICYISRDKAAAPKWQYNGYGDGRDNADEKPPMHIRPCIYEVDWQQIKYLRRQIDRGVVAHKTLLKLLAPKGLTIGKPLQIEAAIQVLIDNRPCHTMKDWDYYTSRGFWRKKCGFLCTRGCNTTKAANALLEHLKP